MNTDHDHSDTTQFLEDPECLSLWAIGMGGTLIMITTVVFVCGLFYSAQNSEALTKKINITYEQRNMVQDAQQAVLDESARWVSEQNAETGETTSRLIISIDQAMDIVSGGLN